MYLYKDCSDIPIYNFDIIYKSNDFKYLVVDYDGYEDIKVPKGANERWEAIKEEWVKLIDNNTIAYYNQLVLECVYLETRFEVVRTLLNTILDHDMSEDDLDKFKDALKEWDYVWNDKNQKWIEVKRLYKQLKASRNKIDLKLDELKQMREENEMNSEATSLEKQAILIESITGVKIDIRKDSVKKWVEACKLAEDINGTKKKSKWQIVLSKRNKKR